MKSFVKNEKKNLSFSYLDLILVILAFFVLSLGISLFVDSRNRMKPETSFAVTLERVLPSDLKDGIPKAGGVLYGEDGDVLGTVLSVFCYDEAAKIRLVIEAKLSAKPTEEKMTVETASFFSSMEIISVEEYKGEIQ